MKPSKKTRSRKPLAAKSSKPGPSSSAEILGATASTGHAPKIPAKWRRHHRHLSELRNQLLLQAGKLAKEATEGTPTFSMHMADAGTDSFDRDFALSMLSSDQDALYEIEEAVKRIENGTYGRCELTGKPIPATRLAAIPWARFSALAQRQLERDGVLKRRQLSAFTSLPTVETAESEAGDEGSAEAEKE